MDRDKIIEEAAKQVYQLQSTAATSDFYDQIATGYDDTVSKNFGYLLPDRIAKIYKTEANGMDKDILDVGFGTGLIARALDMPSQNIKGVDVSDVMLAISDEKRLYSGLFKTDMNAPQTSLPRDFGAVVSAGC